MEEDLKRTDRTTFIVAVLLLLGLMAGLAVMFYISIDAASQAPANIKRSLVRLAWINVLLLGLTAVAMVWVVLRRAILMSQPSRHEPTEYVNAWKIAGERFTLSKDIPVVEDGDDEEDDEKDEEPPKGRK